MILTQYCESTIFQYCKKKRKELRKDTLLKGIL